MGEQPSITGVGGLALALRRTSASVHEFREESSWVFQALLIVGFAGLTGISAQVSFYLPFTTVPVTGQVFAVLLSGGALGLWRGALAQVVYVGLGALGLPWFAPAAAGAAPFSTGGYAVIVGDSGGFILGFIVAAAFVGWAIDRSEPRSFSTNLAFLLSGVGIVYAIGALQFHLVTGFGWPSTTLYAVLPFVPGDILKAVLCALVLLPLVPLSAARAGPAAPALRRRDYLAIAALVASVWLLVPLAWTLAVQLAPGIVPPSVILGYYLLASSVSTAAVLAAIGLRVRVRRALAASPSGRSST